jgi:hypothetical protein
LDGLKKCGAQGEYVEKNTFFFNPVACFLLSAPLVSLKGERGTWVRIPVLRHVLLLLGRCSS